MNIKKAGFVGLGLIGGSIAKTMKRINPDVRLIATAGHESTITEAYEDGCIENNHLLLPEDFADCDYIFLCTPVKTNIHYLKQFRDIIKKDCIITDVGSVKGDIHKEVKRLGMGEHFIGGHPMTGSEKTGFSSATPYLLENAYYIITPSEEVNKKAVDDFHSFVKELGAIPLLLDYETHDHATASISHLPHIIAASLVNLVEASDDEAETMKMIAAGGFKDITRIASSSPEMWESICLSNRDAILDMMDRYLTVFHDIRQKISSADADEIREFFISAKNYRDSLLIKKKISAVFEIYCDLIDEEGGIATIATILASHHINIKNIGIIHNREFEQGVLHIEFYDKNAFDRAHTLLADSGYTIYIR